MNRLSNKWMLTYLFRAARPDTRTRSTISAGREASRTVPPLGLGEEAPMPFVSS